MKGLANDTPTIKTLSRNFLQQFVPCLPRFTQLMHEDNANIDINTSSQPSETIREPEPCRGRRRLSVISIELPDMAPPKYTTATILSKPPVYTEEEARGQPRAPRLYEGNSRPCAPTGGFYEQYVDRTMTETSPERLPWYRYKLTLWGTLFAIIILISVIVHFIRPNTM